MGQDPRLEKDALYVQLLEEQKAETTGITADNGHRFKREHEMSDLFTSDAFEQVDVTEAETGVLKNVKLLGLRSKNRRTYDTEGVRKTAISKLTGARIFLDHPDEPNKTRRYSDSFGAVESVEYRSGQGWFGTIKYNPEHPLAKKFAWDVRNVPKTFGMSINAVAKFGSRNSDGDVVVESLEEIRSVDVVTRPGTAEGIFEEEDMTKPGEPAVDAEKESLMAQLKEAQESLAAIQRETAAQKERTAVTESFSATMKDMPIPADLQKEIVECACQMAGDTRDKFNGLLAKMGPLFKSVDDSELDDPGVNPAAEESEKPAPRVGSGGRKGGYSLLESLGLK